MEWGCGGVMVECVVAGEERWSGLWRLEWSHWGWRSPKETGGFSKLQVIYTPVIGRIQGRWRSIENVDRPFCPASSW